MTSDKACPKCNGAMTRGAMRGDTTVLWSEIKESKIFGVTAVQSVGTVYNVDAYRCDQCGYVELYATRAQGSK